jgi:hypothetical protein
VTVAVSVIVETIGALLPSGAMIVPLGADAVSVRVTVAPKVAVCVIVTTFVTEIVEPSQDPVPSSWGKATRFSIEPAVARVVKYAKAVMADVANFIFDEVRYRMMRKSMILLSQTSEHLCSKKLNECRVKNEMLTERQRT